MCYNTLALNTDLTSAILKCNQCGADLIVKKTTTSKNERSFSSMTLTIYLCSNKECQEEIDKRTAKRLELKNEQDLARQRRLAKNKPVAAPVAS